MWNDCAGKRIARQSSRQPVKDHKRSGRGAVTEDSLATCSDRGPDQAATCSQTKLAVALTLVRILKFPRGRAFPRFNVTRTIQEPRPETPALDHEYLGVCARPDPRL